MIYSLRSLLVHSLIQSVRQSVCPLLSPVTRPSQCCMCLEDTEVPRPWHLTSQSAVLLGAPAPFPLGAVGKECLHRRPRGPVCMLTSARVGKTVPSGGWKGIFLQFLDAPVGHMTQVCGMEPVNATQGKLLMPLWERQADRAARLRGESSAVWVREWFVQWLHWDWLGEERGEPMKLASSKEGSSDGVVFARAIGEIYILCWVVGGCLKMWAWGGAVSCFFCCPSSCLFLILLYFHWILLCPLYLPLLIRILNKSCFIISLIYWVTQRLLFLIKTIDMPNVFSFPSEKNPSLEARPKIFPPHCVCFYELMTFGRKRTHKDFWTR